MGIPAFLVRKLYKRGSLRETADGRFGFTIHNPLGTATLIAPPKFTINGVRYRVDQVSSKDVDIATVSPEAPFVFRKGMEADFSFPGRLLRGANRIHLVAQTQEFDVLELLVEDSEADYCDLPGAREEE